MNLRTGNKAMLWKLWKYWKIMYVKFWVSTICIALYTVIMKQVKLCLIKLYLLHYHSVQSNTDCGNQKSDVHNFPIFPELPKHSLVACAKVHQLKCLPQHANV